MQSLGDGGNGTFNLAGGRSLFGALEASIDTNPETVSVWRWASSPDYVRADGRGIVEYVRWWDPRNPDRFFPPIDEPRDCEAARLIYQPFWHKLRSGELVAYGHPERLSAPAVLIADYLWDDLSVIRLQDSSASDGRVRNGATFLGVRVFDASAGAGPSVGRTPAIRQRDRSSPKLEMFVADLRALGFDQDRRGKSLKQIATMVFDRRCSNASRYGADDLNLSALEALAKRHYRSLRP